MGNEIRCLDIVLEARTGSINIFFKLLLIVLSIAISFVVAFFLSLAAGFIFDDLNKFRWGIVVSYIVFFPVGSIFLYKMVMKLLQHRKLTKNYGVTDPALLKMSAKSAQQNKRRASERRQNYVRQWNEIKESMS